MLGEFESALQRLEQRERVFPGVDLSALESHAFLCDASELSFRHFAGDAFVVEVVHHAVFPFPQTLQFALDVFLPHGRHLAFADEFLAESIHHLPGDGLGKPDGIERLPQLPEDVFFVHVDQACVFALAIRASVVGIVSLTVLLGVPRHAATAFGTNEEACERAVVVPGLRGCRVAKGVLEGLPFGFSENCFVFPWPDFTSPFETTHVKRILQDSVDATDPVAQKPSRDFRRNECLVDEGITDLLQAVSLQSQIGHAAQRVTAPRREFDGATAVPNAARRTGGFDVPVSKGRLAGQPAFRCLTLHGFPGTTR